MHTQSISSVHCSKKNKPPLSQNLCLKRVRLYKSVILNVPLSHTMFYCCIISNYNILSWFLQENFSFSLLLWLMIPWKAGKKETKKKGSNARRTNTKEWAVLTGTPQWLRMQCKAAVNFLGSRQKLRMELPVWKRENGLRCKTNGILDNFLIGAILKLKMVMKYKEAVQKK